MSNSTKEFAKRVGTERVKYRGDSISGETPSVKQMDPTAAPPAYVAKRWATSGDTLYWGAPESRGKLKAGYYRCDFHPVYGPIVVPHTLTTDGLLELPDEAGEAVLAEFNRFWQIEDKFRSYGFLWKRGFLLWGPPGGGKTSTIQLMIRKLIAEHEGVVLAIEAPNQAIACLQLIRAIEPKRPLVCIMEDFDAMISRHGENEYLAMLDGEAQVDNVVFLATTNYPERLDKRFVDRPSRFDTIMCIGMPSAAARTAYLAHKDPELAADPATLAHWVTQSKGFSIAHLREMIVAVRCLGQSLESVVKRLEEMHERQPTSEDAADRSPAGFLSRRRHNGNGHYDDGRVATR